MKKLINTFLIFSILIYASTLMAQTKDKEKIFDASKSLYYVTAENGGREAQYFLALEFLKINKKEDSLKYFIKAAAQGQITAKMYLALLNINGLTEEEINLNEDLFKKLAEFNLKNPEAASLNYELDLTQFYLNTKEKNLKNALKYLESIKLHNRDAAFALAVIYFNGVANIPKDEVEGLKLMNLSAENGHNQAIDFLNNLEEKNKSKVNKDTKDKINQ